MATDTAPQLRSADKVLVQVKSLVIEYRQERGRHVRAVDGLNIDVAAGETLGLVGESGCGKSSTVRAMAMLQRPTSGSISIHGRETTRLHGSALRQLRKSLQIIFQDPISSLNPRRRVLDLVSEPLAIWEPRTSRSVRWRRASEMLEQVGLDSELIGSGRAHELSGGQAQRVCIARALMLSPQLLLCDEPISALDVSVQAQILNLLEELKPAFGLSMVFVSHDLRAVKSISDRVAVMYLGSLCELASATEIYETPRHPYTALLLSSIPLLSGGAQSHPPRAAQDLRMGKNALGGCPFRDRCPNAQTLCAEAPPVREISPGHFVACHFPLQAASRTGKPD
jgi:peptide/nickel transport system ATP-binding protein